MAKLQPKLTINTAITIASNRLSIREVYMHYIFKAIDKAINVIEGILKRIQGSNKFDWNNEE